MIKLFRSFLLLLGVVGVLQFATPAIVSAQIDPLGEACQGAAAESPACANRNQTENPISGSGGIIIKVANLVAFFVGVVSVIMIIWGGIKMVISNGDANAFKTGRSTVIYALVGVVVVLLARSLIIFVINRF